MRACVCVCVGAPREGGGRTPGAHYVCVRVCNSNFLCDGFNTTQPYLLMAWPLCCLQVLHFMEAEMVGLKEDVMQQEVQLLRKLTGS